MTDSETETLPETVPLLDFFPHFPVFPASLLVSFNELPHKLVAVNDPLIF
jgi:hypothetical protein